MKSSTPLCLLLVAAAGLLATACNSVDARIKEKSAVYNQLTPTEQQTIQRGYITVGFTRDMVYMALDKPESVVSGPGPNEESWIYHNFYSRDGSTNMPPQRLVTHVSADSGGGGAPTGATQMGGSRSMPGAIGTAGQGLQQPHQNTFTVEPDYAAENVKLESHIRVSVKFVGDRVASIDIIRI